jgi:hypothetical protein
MKVLDIKMKHPTTNKYFPKHILFSKIYLFQEQKLNHRNYSEKELNMSNFVQANDHDVHMYAKFGGLTFYVIWQLITPGFDL